MPFSINATSNLSISPIPNQESKTSNSESKPVHTFASGSSSYHQEEPKERVAVPRGNLNLFSISTSRSARTMAELAEDIYNALNPGANNSRPFASLSYREKTAYALLVMTIQSFELTTSMANTDLENFLGSHRNLQIDARQLRVAIQIVRSNTSNPTRETIQTRLTNLREELADTLYRRLQARRSIVLGFNLIIEERRLRAMTRRFIDIALASHALPDNPQTWGRESLTIVLSLLISDLRRREAEIIRAIDYLVLESERGVIVDHQLFIDIATVLVERAAQLYPQRQPPQPVPPVRLTPQIAPFVFNSDQLTVCTDRLFAGHLAYILGDATLYPHYHYPDYNRTTLRQIIDAVHTEVGLNNDFSDAAFNRLVDAIRAISVPQNLRSFDERAALDALETYYLYGPLHPNREAARSFIITQRVRVLRGEFNTTTRARGSQGRPSIEATPHPHEDPLTMHPATAAEPSGAALPRAMRRALETGGRR